MARKNSPIDIGRGFTPVWIVVCLTEKAWNKATKGFDVAFPSELHASCTHFPAKNKHSPFSVITLHPDWRKRTEDAMPLLAHEAIHCKQRAEEMMVTTFDHETEAYYVQTIVMRAWRKIKKAR